MQGTMVVPGRGRFATSPQMGHVRLARAFALGQVQKQQPIEAIQDLPAVISVGEFASLPLNEKEALAAYEVTQLLLAIRAKVVYLGIVISDVFNRPDMLSAFRQTSAKERANEELTAVSRFAKKLSMPNFLGSINNLSSALEINVLPRFGLYARGTIPQVKIAGQMGAPRNDFYGSGVSVNIPPGRPDARVLDFGDLFASNVVGDIIALERVVNSGALPGAAAKLGEPITLTVALAIGIIIVIAGATIVLGAWALKGIFSEKDIPNAVGEIIKSPEFRAMTPEQQAATLDAFKKADGFFEKATGLITTLIVGAAAITVLGITVKLLVD